MVVLAIVNRNLLADSGVKTAVEGHLSAIMFFILWCVMTRLKQKGLFELQGEN